MHDISNSGGDLIVYIMIVTAMPLASIEAYTLFYNNIMMTDMS